MATVQLSDIYNPLVFDSAIDEKAEELNAFLNSGVIVNSPELDAMATVGGNVGEMPFHNTISVASEPNYSTDVPGDTSTPDNIDTAKAKYRLASMNKSWSTMDLARELALMDPLMAITSAIGGYWATQYEKRVIQSALGILADNVANDDSDMLYKISSDSSDAVSDDEKISATAVLTTKQTMGDHADSLAVIAMHSVLYTRLQLLNLIDYIPNARGEITIPTYLGYRVVVDDSMPAVAGSNRITYTSILFAAGVFEAGAGKVLVPSELERVAAAGNGGGQDIIHTRKSAIIQPFGFSFLSDSIAGQSATWAELADATEWDRVRSRKNCGIAFLQTNG